MQIDHSTPAQYRRTKSGRDLRSSREKAPRDWRRRPSAGTPETGARAQLRHLDEHGFDVCTNLAEDLAQRFNGARVFLAVVFLQPKSIEEKRLRHSLDKLNKQPIEN